MTRGTRRAVPAARLLAGAILACALGALALASIAIAVNSPPKITKNPVSVTVEEGQPASFTAAASGTPAPTVQWEVSTNGGSSWSPIGGATSPTLTIASAQLSESGNEFRAVFTNVAGSATSTAAVLTVHKAPTVTLQPSSTAVPEGQNATFESTATGVPEPTVQWQQSSNGGATWGNVSGATATKLTVTAVKSTQNGFQYRAVFKNAAGTTNSNAAVLTVERAPSVTHQPASITVEAGQPATFEATASGNPAPGEQWEISTDGGAAWTPIEGATATTFTIAATNTGENGYEFRATFSNVIGTATSQAAVLSVHQAPSVILQPSSTTVLEGHNAVFEAAASGTPAPTVQWQLSTNGGTAWANITGATSTMLTVSAVKESQNGNEYRAVFKNAAGTATTSAAVLTVQRPPSVTHQPADVAVEGGEPASFEATASGLPKPTVQWELSTDGGATWSAIEGATADKFTIPEAQPGQDGNEYRAVFMNAAGTVTTNAATLHVRVKVNVTQQPKSLIVQAGETAVFSSAASGFPAPTVKWESSTNNGSTWTEVPGATSEQLTVPETTLAQSGTEYRAVFTNVYEKATSAAARLTVASHNYRSVAWGLNGSRQLGIGTTQFTTNAPAPTSGLGFVTAVAAGGAHSLAVLADGSVMAWGNNESGQLGNGEIGPDSGVPVPVSGLTGVTAVAAGRDFSLALLSNGTVMAWGAGEVGQLGTGSSAGSDVPVAVKGLANVRAIAAGGEHSLALLANGTVMAWGENGAGELGDGTISNRTSPVPVKGLAKATGVAAGEAFSLAAVANGTVDAWGENLAGQLGNKGAEEFSDVPLPVEGLSGVTSVAAGAQHGLALLSGGTVMAWGAGSLGQLGNGTMPARSETPVAVSNLSGVSAVAAGGSDSAALLASGQIMTWGSDKNGTLGDAITGQNSDVPVAVAGLRKAAAVSVGGAHMLAFGEPIPTVDRLEPAAGPASGGNVVQVTGTQFSGATAVHFGTAVATNVNVTSPTTLEATAPPGTGTVDVSVETPDGESFHAASDHYTYVQQPTVTGLKPKSGPVTGGTKVVIHGTELLTTSSVTFAGVPATSVKIISATEISAVDPAGSPAIVDVRVTTLGGTSTTTTADRFRYTPVVSSLSPTSGSKLGGTEVTVTGAGFSTAPGATLFRFGTTLAKTIGCASSTTCTVLSPAHEAGTVTVTASVNKVVSEARPGDTFTFE